MSQDLPRGIEENQVTSSWFEPATEEAWHVGQLAVSDRMINRSAEKVKYLKIIYWERKWLITRMSGKFLKNRPGAKWIHEWVKLLIEIFLN